MGEPANAIEPVEEPDVEHLVTEDDTPVDNPFSERQQKLLSDCLETSYTREGPFVAMVNVGLYSSPEVEPLVPDFLLSLDVTFPEKIWDKRNRSYFIWRYGKPPDLALEIVSNRKGGEDSTKLADYARMRVAYYVIFDPTGVLNKKRRLRLFEMRAGQLVELLDPFVGLELLGLRLCLWEGTYAQMSGTWVRFTDIEGNLLLTGTERAEQERARAEQERERAEQAQERVELAQAQAKLARERAERLARRLAELGVDPGEI